MNKDKKNRPTLGGGVKVADGEYDSAEVNPSAIVFSAFGVDFNKEQLEKFIESQKDMMPVYVKNKSSFELNTFIDPKDLIVIRLTPDYERAKNTSYHDSRTGSKINVLIETKKILDLFSPYYFNQYFNINQDPEDSFNKACNEAYQGSDNTNPVIDDTKKGSLDDLPTWEEQYPNGTAFDQQNKLNQQIDLLKEKLLVFRPELKEEINRVPILTVIALIDGFIETQKEVDESIKNNGQVILVRSDVNLNDLNEDELHHMLASTTDMAPQDIKQTNEKTLTPK